MPSEFLYVSGGDETGGRAAVVGGANGAALVAGATGEVVGGATGAALVAGATGAVVAGVVAGATGAVAGEVTGAVATAATGAAVVVGDVGTTRPIDERVVVMVAATLAGLRPLGGAPCPQAAQSAPAASRAPIDCASRPT